MQTEKLSENKPPLKIKVSLNGWGSSCHLGFTTYQIVLDKNLCISMICNEVKATGGTKIGYYILTFPEI